MADIKSYFRKHRRFFFFLAVLSGITLIFSLLYIFSSSAPEFTENVYTQKIFGIINTPVKYFLSLFPFSVAEVMLWTVILFLLVFLVFSAVKTVIDSVKAKKFRGKISVKFLCTLLCLALLSLSLFIVNGAFNYSRPSFAELNEYEIKDSSVEELKKLTEYLLMNACAARSLLKEDENGVITSSVSTEEICEKASRAYEKIAGSYNIPEGFYPDPKPAIMSELMCYLRITGIYPYIVPEAIYNSNTPLPALPHTICHEMAHQRGYALEDEANYVAYLACINSGVPELVYSGYYEMYLYAANALGSHSPDALSEVNRNMSAGMARDISFSGNFWKQYETKNNVIATVSETVNDTYLKVNNVDDGVYSYGRVVDLLLAEYRQTQSNQ